WKMGEDDAKPYCELPQNIRGFMSKEDFGSLISTEESLELVFESGLTGLLSAKKLCMKVNSSSHD
ncbi:hypothetical protein Tco_0416075, partial [Tanacetum coccineum]